MKKTRVFILMCLLAVTLSLMGFASNGVIETPLAPLVPSTEPSTPMAEEYKFSVLKEIVDLNINELNAN